MDTPEKKRPTFLTVLCILTFIGSGLSALSSAYGLMTGRMSQDQIEEAEYELLNDVNDDVPEIMTNFIDQSLKIIYIQNENHYTIELTNLLVALLALGGALLMFRLDKKGFGLYVFGQILAVGSLFYYFGSFQLIVLTASIAGFISVLFIIMYAVNLKHMN